MLDLELTLNVTLHRRIVFMASSVLFGRGADFDLT